jgi:hypothetical protein
VLGSNRRPHRILGPLLGALFDFLLDLLGARAEIHRHPSATRPHEHLSGFLIDPQRGRLWRRCILCPRGLYGPEKRQAHQYSQPDPPSPIHRINSLNHCLGYAASDGYFEATDWPLRISLSCTDV